jgi:hypothetical protein
MLIRVMLTIRTWRKTSLESLLLHGDDTELDAQTASIVSASSPAAAVRIARFLIHLLTGHPITTTIIFKRLAQVLQRTKGTELDDQVKIVIFGAAVFKEYCVTEKGNEYRECECFLESHKISWLIDSASLSHRIAGCRVIYRYRSCCSYHLASGPPFEETEEV